MADELADVQNEQNQAALEPEAPIGREPSEKPEKATEKPEKLTRRQSIEKAFVEQRTKEEKQQKQPVEAKEPPAEKSEPKKDVQPKAPEASGLPPGWSPETKAFVASLPPDHPLRKDVEKREKEISEGFKKYGEKDKQYQEFEQVLAPVRPLFQQMGIRDVDGVRNALTWASALQNPQTRMQAFQQLAQSLGVNLNSPQSENPDPLRPVYDQFGQLSQTVSSLQEELQRSRQEKVSEVLAAFSKDKPHFEKVRVRMGQLIQAGVVPAHELERAYQEAIWADPEIRATLTKEQFDKQEAERKAEQTRRAREARQAAISPSTRAPAGEVTTNAKGGKQSVRDAINASIKELSDQRA